MRTELLETAADHAAERAFEATGIRPEFRIVEASDELRLLCYDEPLVTITPGVQVAGDVDRADYPADEIGERFARELSDVRGWTAADLVSVRQQALEKRLPGIEARVGRRLATLLRRRFVDPRTCLHGSHGGVVDSLVYDIASAPAASGNDARGSDRLAVEPVVLDDADSRLDSPGSDGEWPTTGLHVWNDTTVEAFFPAGDDPADPFDIEVRRLIEQITVAVGPAGNGAVSRAEQELEAHGEAYLRPADDPEFDWDEATFRDRVEAVSAAVAVPHRLELAGIRARLVERTAGGELATDGGKEPAFDVGDPRYLPSPEEAVAILEALVADWDFETLARYYDFSRLDDLEESGVYVHSWPEPHRSWFTNEHAPHVAIQSDPVVRFRHPFPPTFEYVDHEVKGDVATVVVEGSWDIGFEDETQAGRWAFRLIRHDEGWQVQPDPVEVIEGDDPP